MSDNPIHLDENSYWKVHAECRRQMDQDKITKALVYATIKHAKQTRKGDGSPYIIHPIRVADKLMRIGDVYSPHIISAAYLHDVCEDCGVSVEELNNEFGTITGGIVGEVTDDKSLPKAERKKLQVEHAPHMSNGAKLVKLADKLDNLSDLRVTPPKKWSLEQVQGYFLWAKHVVQGLRGTNAALEKELDEIFAGNLIFQGKQYPCIAPGNENELLQNYYKLMETVD